MAASRRTPRGGPLPCRGAGLQDAGESLAARALRRGCAASHRKVRCVADIFGGREDRELGTALLKTWGRGALAAGALEIRGRGSA